MTTEFFSDQNVPSEKRIWQVAHSLADEFSGVFNLETVHRQVQ